MIDINDQIEELQKKYVKLKNLQKLKNKIILSGILEFTASAEKCEPMTGVFEIEIIIPGNYPRSLPKVKETGGKISKSYPHIYEGDETLCSAFPLEEYLIFREQPSLLGFVEKLVVPYFFSYLYWEKYGKFPFGERKHDVKGVMDCYLEILRLPNELSVLKCLDHILRRGYSGKHECPCGSGVKIHKCHPELRILCETGIKLRLKQDYFDLCNAYRDGRFR